MKNKLIEIGKKSKKAFFSQPNSKKKNKEGTEDLKNEQFELQIALQLTVSALNQTTGALL